MAVDTTAPIVIKIGGGVLGELEVFWQQVASLQSPVVIVHGGGAQSTELARQLGHSPRIINGRRVTSHLDLCISEWVMRGSVNVRLVAEARACQNLKCVGLSGADGNLITVRKREPWVIDGETVDFGWVGEITQVNPQLIHLLHGAGFIPIIAPLGIGPDGQRYNVNADTVAAMIAQTLKAAALYLVTDTGGLMRHASRPETLLANCRQEDFQQGLKQGWITGGMGVKLQVAFEALEAGVGSVYILGPDDLIDYEHATRVQL